MKITDVIDEKYAETLDDACVIGVDIGSRATKCVLLDRGELYSTILPSGVSSQETSLEAINELLERSGRKLSDVQYIVGTGYGRVAINYGSVPVKIVTEISCHAMGAHYLNPKTRTIIDIGGQDTKAIKVDHETGRVIEFIMNDKCAAGTGRFLEKVAQMLEIDLRDLGEQAVRADKPAQISSQCVVFAESEVISLKAKGESRANISAGIHYANARRIKSLINRIDIEDVVLFTGGVSNNKGMRSAIEDVLQVTLGKTKLDLTLAGAFGAAVYAVHYLNNTEE
ncbi:MAG: 2-hydroxyglutaryl-CoA dehydratase [Oscillospiraceae bacterium]|nr:2-hydroxyglutaryl-CoA dehydratase [Oscillospiraceae bacterium]